MDIDMDIKLESREDRRYKMEKREGSRRLSLFHIWVYIYIHRYTGGICISPRMKVGLEFDIFCSFSLYYLLVSEMLGFGLMFFFDFFHLFFFSFFLSFFFREGNEDRGRRGREQRREQKRGEERSCEHGFGFKGGIGQEGAFLC